MKNKLVTNSKFNNIKVNTSKNEIKKIKREKVVHVSADTRLGIFRLVLLILIAVVLFRYLSTGFIYDFSFKSFIDILSNAPDFSFGFNLPRLYVSGPWPGLEGLRSFINMNLSILELGLFLSSMVLNGLRFILYLFTSLFL